MQIRTFFDIVTCTYTYLIIDEKTKKAVIIDSVDNKVDNYLKIIDDLDLDLIGALDTHVHADHITAIGLLREKTGCESIIGEQSANTCASKHISDNEIFKCGDLELKAIYTPGHTDDSYCFLVEDSLFTGDTLFIRGTGGTDFQNGDSIAQYDSIFNKLFKLDGKTVVYPGHDYNGNLTSTIAEEKAYNPRLQVSNEEEYAEIMDNLNLPNPRYMDMAIPNNLVCGLSDD